MEEAASCSLSPSPTVLVLPIGLADIGGYVEIGDRTEEVGKEDRSEGEDICQKEKEEGRKRHLRKNAGIFLSCNLQEGCFHATYRLLF